MTHTVYTLDVRLRDISPPIWRTIEIAGSSTLEDLHFALQVAMGWTNSHLHQFVIGDASYGMVDVDQADDLDIEDERRFQLQDLVEDSDSFLYEYDFGDTWEHEVTVKRIAKVAESPQPSCINGARACPPEDCGGTGGYENLLKVLADPSHEEHTDLVEWSEDFQPEHFEIPKTGRDLRREMDQLKALAKKDDSDEVDEGPVENMRRIAPQQKAPAKPRVARKAKKAKRKAQRAARNKNRSR